MKPSKQTPVYGETIAAALGLSALSSITATIVLAAIIAFLMNTEKITDTSIGYSGMGILLGASFAGAITAEKRFNGNRLLAGLLSGVVYFLILIGVTTFLFSFAGVKLGSVFGSKYEKKAEILGGIILILIGLKILLEHLGVINF